MRSDEFFLYYTVKLQCYAIDKYFNQKKFQDYSAKDHWSMALKRSKYKWDKKPVEVRFYLRFSEEHSRIMVKLYFYSKRQNCIKLLQQWEIYEINTLACDNVINFWDTCNLYTYLPH